LRGDARRARRGTFDHKPEPATTRAEPVTDYGSLRPAPEWDICTAMRLWNVGGFGPWWTFDYSFIRFVLGRACVPYSDLGWKPAWR
jgi:hypothetical protein